MKYVEATVAALLRSGARMATKYVSEKEIVRATRRRYRGKIVKNAKNTDIVLTLGRPNYRERIFIKRCRAAGEPFPIKKIQLRLPSR